MKSTAFSRKFLKQAVKSKKSVDLHMHSTFSDGEMGVPDLIDLCHRNGVSAMAITDHDNIDAFEDGKEYAASLGIEFLTGVEISSQDEGSDIHILGYCFDPTHLRLNQTLVRLRERRKDRAREIIARLNRMGFEISFEKIDHQTGNGAIGRAHIAMAMLEAAYVESFQDAFNRYLGNDSDLMAGIISEKLSPESAIRLIQEAGGVAVLAHPSKTARDDLIQDMVDMGLRGIETFCHGQTFACAQKYRDIARRYGLVCTGGADFHAQREDGRHGPGSLRIPYSVVERLRETQAA